MRLSLAGVGKGLIAAVMLVAAVLFAMMAQHGTRPKIAEQMPVSEPADASVPDADHACRDLGRLIIPVDGVAPAQLVDTFNDARSEGRRHDALDILAPRGAPVLAAGEGRVEKLFASRAGGNTVYVRSPEGRVLYYYAHLDGYAPGLREGQTVRQGTHLGSVGSTGNADPAAPHLHFAILATSPARKWWEPARPLNPFEYLAGPSTRRPACRTAE